MVKVHFWRSSPDKRIGALSAIRLLRRLRIEVRFAAADAVAVDKDSSWMSLLI